MPKNQGEYRGLERVVKGFANHRRLRILEILKDTPELSIEEIAEKLDMGYMNTSDHLRKMALAGLVLKRSANNSVRHRLTPRADLVLGFLQKAKIDSFMHAAARI